MIFENFFFICQLRSGSGEWLCSLRCQMIKPSAVLMTALHFKTLFLLLQHQVLLPSAKSLSLLKAKLFSSRALKPPLFPGIRMNFVSLGMSDSLPPYFKNKSAMQEQKVQMNRSNFYLSVDKWLCSLRCQIIRPSATLIQTLH